MATPAVLTGDRPARCPRRNRRPGDIPQHGPGCIGADRRATRPDQSTPGRRPTGPRLHAPGPARYPTISHHTTRLSQPSHRGGSAYLTRAGPTTPRRRDIRTLQPRPQSSTLEDLVPDCKFLGHATCPTHRETRQGSGGILGYRSFQNYYTQARQEHRRLTGEDPAADIEQAITDVSRSIRRAQGPTPFKDSFQLELLSADQFPVDQDDGLDSIAYARDVTIIGCWWLLRGLEVASAQVHHLWTQQTALGKRTYLTLPIQKNDITGMCVTRSHPCTCPALSRLCPHHAAQRHMRRLHRHLGRTPPGDYPLFPGPDGQAIPKADVIELFRKVIGLTGTILTRTDPSGTLRQRFHEHVCRVSGAQFLTRLGYNKETVQLVGRWGSEAVARYIQESNLDRPPMAHSQKELQHQIEDVVKRHIAVLHNTFWVVNTDSNKAHLPATDEDCINSAMWTTQCGWRYATGRYKKIRTKPTNNLCGSCFKFATQADLDELSDLGD